MSAIERLNNFEVWKLPSGTVIRCSNDKCNEYIGRITKDIKMGDRIDEHCIEGPHIRRNELPRCGVCGHYWYLKKDTASGILFTRLHTGRGWFPDDERMKEFQ